MQSYSQSGNYFTFTTGTSQALLAQTSQNERVVNSGCTHHMAKDASLFSSLNVSTKNNIYVVNEFALDIVGHGDITCQHL